MCWMAALECKKPKDNSTVEIISLNTKTEFKLGEIPVQGGSRIKNSPVGDINKSNLFKQ